MEQQNKKKETAGRVGVFSLGFLFQFLFSLELLHKDRRGGTRTQNVYSCVIFFDRERDSPLDIL